MLDVGRGAVNTYACQPWREAAGGVALSGHGVLLTGNRSPLVGQLDLHSLQETVQALQSLRAKGQAAVLAFDVHCRTMEAATSRRAFVAALEAIPAEEQALLAIGITGLPDGAPAGRIAGIVSFLRRFCRAVSVIRPLRYPRPERLEGSGAYGAIVALDNAPHSERAVSSWLDDFTHGASRHQLKALASGLSSPGLVAYAMLHGFAYVSGDGFLPPQPHPEGARRFACDAFLRGLDAQAILASQPDTPR